MSAHSPSIKNYQFIQRICELPFVDTVYLFGSRARGDHRAKSDIDLAIVCPSATTREWHQILDLIEQADTLLQIDCVRYDRVSDKKFKTKIDRDKVALYKKGKTNESRKIKRDT